jgi:hypothetical protein
LCYAPSRFDGCHYRRKKTAVYKRFNGKRIKPNDPNWERGTWVVEFSLRGHYIKEGIPEARTKKQAEQIETQIRQAIFDRKYNRASTVTSFKDFVDNVFLPWARENKDGKAQASDDGLL